MTDVNRREGSQITLADVDRRFGQLAANPVPLFLSDPERAVMHLALQEAGRRVEIPEEVRESLMEVQFRTLNDGRGPGLVYVMGSRENAEQIIQLCAQLRPNGPLFTSPSTGVSRPESRYLGEQQLVADLVSLSVLSDPRDLGKIYNRINRRFWRGALSQAEGNTTETE